MPIRNPLYMLAIALACAWPAAVARAADHLDAPLVALDGRTDINDLYAFQSPANASKTVLIMTVNPLAGMLSGTAFHDMANYKFSIDNDGDAVADVVYNAQFSAPSGGSQNVQITRTAGGSTAAYASGSTETNIVAGNATVRAGVFDDPFFFDLNGFRNGLAFTGDDFFAGANVSAIVLEIPSAELGGPNVGIFATTEVGGSRVDRMGRPAINTVLIPSGRKDEFNQTDPTSDLATFGADVNAAITGLSNSGNAAALTPILLPDLLTFDTSNSSGFLNGRQLANDVIDAELTLLTASATPVGDGVDANDVPFLSAFPYLAPANAIVPEPGTIGLAALGLTATVAFRRRRR